MALTKVSGGILDPGINVAGIVTATGFDGPFTGGSTKNIIAGIITATGFDFNGSGDISGNLVIGGNLTANGDFTTLNTTLREVEILRVDASSGEPAGIITQTGAGDILRLYDGTSQVVTVLDTGEVGIGTINPSSYGGAVKLALHSSGHTGLTIAAGTGSDGNIFFADGVSGDTTYRGNIKYAHNGDSMRFHTAAGERLRIDSDGQIGIGNIVPDTWSTGKSITIGTAQATLWGVGDQVNLSGNAYFNSGWKAAATKAGASQIQQALGQIDLRVTGSVSADAAITWIDALSITKTGNIGINNTNPAYPLEVVGDGGGSFSASTNSTHAILSIVGKNSSGSVSAISRIKSYPDGSSNQSHMAFETRNSSNTMVEALRITSHQKVGIGTNNPSDMLHVVGSARFIKTSNNYVHVGSSNAGGAAIVLDGDSNGDGVGADYAYIEHDTSGDLNIVVDNPANAGNIKFLTNTSSERLRILSDGAIRIPDGSNSTSRLLIGSGAGALYVYHDGNTKFENATGYLKLQCNNSLYIDGNEIFFRDEGGTNRWRILTTGHLVPGAVGSYDIGSTGAEIGDVYLADGKSVYLGSDQDVRIYYDSAGSTAFTIDANAGYMYINSDALRLNSKTSAWNYLRGDKSDGVVKLYKSNSERLATSDTGITVTGEVAASQDYPNYRPTLDFNFAAQKKLDPRITYEKTGPASFVNEFGKVVLVGDNAPRFDHDPITRECRGLLIEESRTNQMIYSSDITADVSQNSGYTVTNGTVTGNQTTAPDGTTTADQFACNTTNSLHRVSIYFTSGQISNSTAYTFSVFVKSNGYDKLHIRYGGYNADNHGLGYDLSDGTTFAGKFDGTGSLGAVTSSSMIEYPNGWYRCAFTFTTASDAATGSAGIFYYISNSESTTNFAGDGSSGMHFWGAQMEVGKFPTSYIPTNGRTVTRGNESFEIDGEDFTDFFNTTEGTVLSHITPLDNSLGNHSGTGGVVWSFDSGAGFGNGHYLSNANSTTAFAHAVMVGNSAQNTGGGTGNMTNGVPFKNATVFKKDDFIMATNGTTASADTSGNLPTVVKLVLGNNGWGNTLNAANIHFNRFAYYSKRLPNTQLVTLTS